MAYVVTSACVKCKYTDCVEVCPVDCFYEIDEMLVIHPDECIDCGICEPECPEEAIVEEADLPDAEQAMMQFNAEQAEKANGIWERKDPLPEADEWHGDTARKRAFLSNKYGIMFG